MENDMIDNFGKSINQDLQKTNRFFSPRKGNPNAGKIGEALKFLNWGGVILQFENEDDTRTYSLADLIEV